MRVNGDEKVSPSSSISGPHCLFHQVMHCADEGKSAGKVFVALLRDESGE
jgi:hypothetical protein